MISIIWIDTHYKARHYLFSKFVQRAQQSCLKTKKLLSYTFSSSHLRDKNTRLRLNFALFILQYSFIKFNREVRPQFLVTVLETHMVNLSLDEIVLCNVCFTVWVNWSIISWKNYLCLYNGYIWYLFKVFYL